MPIPAAASYETQAIRDDHEDDDVRGMKKWL